MRTSFLATRGNGNIGSDPELINIAVGDLQIKPTSPCVDRGNNFVDTLPFGPDIQLAGDFDIFGTPRISDGNGDGVDTVDRGAFEVLASE
jgi:hypothetical protein